MKRPIWDFWTPPSHHHGVGYLPPLYAETARSITKGERDPFKHGLRHFSALDGAIDPKKAAPNEVITMGRPLSRQIREKKRTRGTADPPRHLIE